MNQTNSAEAAQTTQLSVTMIQSLQRQTTDLLTRWQRFGRDSQTAWEQFRNQGACLPEIFFDGLHELQQQRDDLWKAAGAATAGVPKNDWTIPSTDSSLATLEQSLKELADHCHDELRRFDTRKLRLQELLGEIRLLRCNDAFAREVQQSMVQKSEQDRLLVNAATRAEPGELFRIEQAWHGFLRLLTDSLRKRSKEPALKDVQELSHADYEKHFAASQGHLGLQATLMAIRDGFSLTESRIPEFLNLLEPGTSVPERATSAEIASLTAAYNRRPPEPVPTRKEPRPAKANVELYVPDLHELKELIQRLGLPTSTTLHNYVHKVTPTQKTQFAGTIENLRLTAEHINTIYEARQESGEPLRRELQQAFELMAEAQCSVRVCWSQITGEQIAAHPDQLRCFQWLRETVSTDGEGIMLQRYMRMDDVAEPSGFEQLNARIQRMLTGWRESRALPKSLKNLEDSIQAIDATESESLRESWRRVNSFFAAYLRNGGNESDTGLASLLAVKPEYLPAIDDEDEDSTGSLQLCPELEALVERVIADLQQQTLAALENETTEDDSEIAEALRNALPYTQGRRMAIVGGTARPQAKHRITAAFQLQHLEWIPATKRDRVSNVRPQVKDMDIVVLITSLIGHKHNAIREMCTELQIPWVQTKHRAGYGVNQLATIIVEQASEQLERRTA